MEKCYVYAFDINNKKIIAALPSEGVVEAYQACEKANNELKRSGLEHDSLRFGVADLHRDTRTSIGLKRVIEIMYSGGGRPQKPVDVPIEDFETAALHTKDMLSKIQTLDNVPIEIRFMQFVEAILPTCTIRVLPNPYNPRSDNRVSTNVKRLGILYCWIGHFRGKKKKVLYCCDIKDLSKAECDLFVQKSEINDCPPFVLTDLGASDSLPLEKRFEINEAIRRFNDMEQNWAECIDAMNATGEFDSRDLVELGTSIGILSENKRIAENIRASRRPIAAVPPSIADSTCYAHAASGKGNPKSAIPVMTAAEAAYYESIEWADDPVDMNVKNPEAISNPVVEKIGKTNDTLERIENLLQQAFEPVEEPDDSLPPNPADAPKRRRRTNVEMERDTRSAIGYYLDNEHLGVTQREAEQKYELPQGTLSRDKWASVIEDYRKKR